MPVLLNAWPIFFLISCLGSLLKFVDTYWLRLKSDKITDTLYDDLHTFVWLVFIAEVDFLWGTSWGRKSWRSKYISLNSVLREVESEAEEKLTVQYFFVSLSIVLHFMGLAVVFKIEAKVEWLVYTPWRHTGTWRYSYSHSLLRLCIWWVFGFSPCRYTSAGERPRQKSNRLEWSLIRSGHFGGERNLFPLLGVEPRFLARPDHSQVSLRKIHRKYGPIEFVWAWYQNTWSLEYETRNIWTLVVH